MSQKPSLLYIVRENFKEPSLEAEYNQWNNEIHINDVLQRIGSKGWGVRYKIDRNPQYVGWKGPSNVYQYIHIFELDDTPEAISRALRPAGQLPPNRFIVGGRPAMEMTDSVRVVYQRIQGELKGFPPLIYVVRSNWLVPEREEEFRRFYSETLFSTTLKELNAVQGSIYTAISEPGYIGWQGPSRAYMYLSIFELEESPAAVETALRMTQSMQSITSWLDPRPITEMLNGVTAIYRLVMKTTLAGA